MNKTRMDKTRRTLLLLVLVAFPFSSFSQDVTTQQQPVQPTDKNLLHSAVGGTHIPMQSVPPAIINPYAKDKNSIAQGAKLFSSMNCVGCHASQGGGGMGPPLSDSQWIYGSRPEQIFLTIAQGRPNGMPAFGSILPDDSIWKLVSYIQTLSPPNKPETP
ncbi:MAG TPA: cytochrome c [Methylophilaceae bacterium]|jgi:cytochrome c oxidase cbb3-type subunit 3